MMLPIGCLAEASPPFVRLALLPDASRPPAVEPDGGRVSLTYIAWSDSARGASVAKSQRRVLQTMR
jgi:hypothetical protein